MRRFITMLTLITLLGFHSMSFAQTAPAPSSIGWDVEVDPLAYALKGHSLHVGLWWQQWRVDLGSFALTAPTWSHGQDGFTQSFTGFGTKVDRFFGGTRDGFFVGAEAGLAYTTVRLDETGQSDTMPVLNVGGRAGYRWSITERFYATPWLGVGYAFGARDSTWGEARFSPQRVTVFPTLHVGYRIQ